MPREPLAKLILKRREEQRVQRGHPWVFSNEVDVGQTPLSGFEPGQPVTVATHQGVPIGSAYVNPATLICARLVSRRPDVVLDRRLLVERVREADRGRAGLYASPCYRAVFGESDQLPGLVLDRYGDVFVAQIATAGMERIRADVVSAIAEVYDPRVLLIRADGHGRALEGLDADDTVAIGSLDGAEAVVEEDGATFHIDVAEGQKSGWFFDQRDNRTLAARFADGREVLDAFCYSGAFGIRAALAGARHVVFVDSSEPALELVRRNAARNGVESRIELIRGDAFEVLRGLGHERRRFELALLDPPAFIRRRKDLDTGTKAYHRLNRLGVRALAADGLMLSSSCSSYLSESRLQEVVVGAARSVGRRARFLALGHQSADHPVHPAMPESRYLKAVLTRVY